MTTEPKGIHRTGLEPFDSQKRFSLFGRRYAASNFKSSITGYKYGNLPMMVIKKGKRVRWYLATVGTGINFHTPHCHGNAAVCNGQRTDVIALSPAQMVTVEMVPDDPGIWLQHCYVSDHMDAGMPARYQVLS